MTKRQFPSGSLLTPLKIRERRLLRFEVYPVRKIGGKVIRRVAIGMMLSVLVLLCGCGCVYGGDKRPDSNIPSLWISEDPHIEIEFIQGYEDGPVFTSVRGILDPICRVYLDGKYVPCEMWFDRGRGLTITADEDRVISGHVSMRINSFPLMYAMIRFLAKSIRNLFLKERPLYRKGLIAAIPTVVTSCVTVHTPHASYSYRATVLPFWSVIAMMSPCRFLKK